MADRYGGIQAVFTIAEAGRRLGVSRQRAHQLVRAGVLGTVAISGRVYVSAVSVELYRRWRDEQRRRGEG